jgi:transcriptional regulator with PAS, ATPase and Fis domain
MERISVKLNKKKVEISEDSMKYFMQYEWPGNVRELENVIELMVNTESIPSFIKMDCNAGKKAEYSLTHIEQATTCERIEEDLNLECMEKKHILKALKIYGGNITLCAKALGIGRNTLYRKIESYGINGGN